MTRTYIATFYSHFGAVRFVRVLKSRGLFGVAKPVPRQLSSSCGTCVEFEASDYIVQDPHGEIEQVVYC